MSKQEKPKAKKKARAKGEVKATHKVKIRRKKKLAADDARDSSSVRDYSDARDDRDARGDSASEKAERRTTRAVAPSALDVFKYVLPILSVVVAFVAAVLLYRRLLPKTVAPEEAAVQTIEAQAGAEAGATNSYAGVKDTWLSGGLFATGSQELDEQVKQYCDALSVEGATASINANTVYNNITWCNYEDRAEGEGPQGTNWDQAAASHFFSTGDPASGVGGSGDVYEFSAAAAYCLRYFGFTDALAVPVVTGDASSGEIKSALVLVTDENGQARVCDPALGANGWMLDRSLYNIVVENIGQNMEPIEALGLYVQEAPAPEDSTDQTTSSVTDDTSAEDGTSSTTDEGQEDAESGTATDSGEYGSDTTGYDATGYSEYGTGYETTSYDATGYSEHGTGLY